MSLLPLRVVGPLFPGAPAIRVQGQVTGARVEIFAEGRLAGAAVVDGPDALIPLDPSLILRPGTAVAARQRSGAEVGPLSPDPVIVGAPGAGPAGEAGLHLPHGSGPHPPDPPLPTLGEGGDLTARPFSPSPSIGRGGRGVRAASPDGQEVTTGFQEVALRAGATWARVTGLVPGARFRVLSDGWTRGDGEAPGEIFDVPVLPLMEGERIAVAQRIGEAWSAPSPARVVGPRPETLAAPVLTERPAAGARALRVAGIEPGARVAVYSVARHAAIGEAVIDAAAAAISLWTPLEAGDEIYAVQRGWGLASAPSAPARVAGAAARVAAARAALGAWELQPAGAEVLAVHAALLRSGKVAYFSGSEHDEWARDFDNSRLWDPATGAVTTISSPPHDLFCCGHAFLADGRLLVGGGTQAYDVEPDADDRFGHARQHHYRGVRDVFFLSPAADGDPWARAASMRFQRGTQRGGGRWYPTLLTLPDGRVLAMSGHPERSDSRHNNTSLELFDPEAGPEGQWLDAGEKSNAPGSYPRLHVLPSGEVLCATPMSGRVERWDPARRVWAPVASGPGAGYGGGIEWSSVLLPLRPPEYRARVLVVGKPASRILDLGPRGEETGLAWSDTAPRSLPAVTGRHGANAVRQHAIALLLPTGAVLMVGGTVDGKDARAILHAELYDPDADRWTTLAAASVPRVYHSVALLLPDGRVWVAGSNRNGDRNRRGDRGTSRDKRELRVEIFSPPYLFAGPRPRVLDAPAAAAPGATFAVATPDPEAIAGVVLMRCGSCTHAFDGDQRQIALAFERRAGGQLSVAAPPDNAVAPPGYYMLFLLSREGVPSEGRFLQVLTGRATP